MNPVQQQLHMTRNDFIIHRYPDSFYCPPRRWCRQLEANKPLPSCVKVELDNINLWKSFHKEGTEMIITKKGRCMFPKLHLRIKGLEAYHRYCIFLEMKPASEQRFKFIEPDATPSNNNVYSQKADKKGWVQAGVGEPQPSLDQRVYCHPDGLKEGYRWMKSVIDFPRLKITNSFCNTGQNLLMLTSMHKYLPRVWIVKSEVLIGVHEIHRCQASVFDFKDAEFIAVTAYQNKNIKKLKINNNPFAKGFRRKRSPLSPEIAEEDFSDNENEDPDFLDDSSQAKRPKLEHTSVTTDSESEEEIDVVALDEDNAKPRIPENVPSVETDEEPRRRIYRPWTDSPRKSSSHFRTSSSTSTPNTSSVSSKPHDTPLSCSVSSVNLPLVPYRTALWQDPNHSRDSYLHHAPPCYSHNNLPTK